VSGWLIKHNGIVVKEEMIEETIRRDVFEVLELHEADDSNYWLDRSPVERIEAIEFMRKVMYGRNRVSERLQRVLTIAELKEN
jgi:hypothetical protein